MNSYSKIKIYHCHYLESPIVADLTKLKAPPFVCVWYTHAHISEQDSSLLYILFS